jgi:hypothetical protein
MGAPRLAIPCDKRLDTTAARYECETAGHTLEICEQGIFSSPRLDGLHYATRRRCYGNLGDMIRA